MLGGPLLSNTQEVEGGGGGISKGHYSGSKSSGGGSQLFLRVLPIRNRRIRGRGEETQTRRGTLFSQDKEGPRKRILANPPPISQTITKIKDLVSESMRWVTGMWWGKQRMLETGVPSHARLPSPGGEQGRGVWGWGRVSNHWSASPKTSFCLRFMFSKSKAEPAMRL